MFDRFLTASERYVAHANGMATAFHDMEEGRGALTRAAFLKGGAAGAEDITAVAGADRLAEEAVGVLMALGFGDALAKAGLTHPGNVRPVTDFTERWTERVRQGQLETRRTR